MENRINIAEILKDCPKGMELDCTCADNVVFDKIIEYEQIKCVIGECRDPLILDKYGRLLHICCPKCVIFPKGKATWEDFQRPFKDGDIVATATGAWIGITTGGESGKSIPTYCVIKSDYTFEAYLDIKKTWSFSRLANEEEKTKLFNAIKDNGYHWNPKTMTLEKLVGPKFKVGDKITNGKISIIIGYIDDEYYYEIGRNIATRLFIKNQDEWDLIPNKFDINTLIPFEGKVLVRDYNYDIWKISFWGCLIDNKYGFRYDTIRGAYKQCIPYEGNEHLLGKTEDCKDFYKTW